ncbi:MAG: UDP-galactopyranose mutase, partial [Clostridia bacterium]|nr:UDP-galactopyranose mutase [Clostridia bacterium]
PHIFHTEEKRVFEFLSRFTEWYEYKHSVLASVKGKTVSLPVSLSSLYTLFPRTKAQRIENALKDAFGEGATVPILELKNQTNPVLKDFAEFVYKNFYYTYTRKQWGLKPEELSGEVMTRVPVCVADKAGYFNDEYQFMPKNGFTETVANILKHPNIKLKLKTDAEKHLYFKDGKIYFDGKELEGKVVYTGRVEEIFGYKFGALPYRTLKFKFKTYNRPSYQNAAVVNYTANKKFTRVTEFTKFTCEKQAKTVIVKEYAKKCKKTDVPYYPIPTEKNKELYAKYFDEAKKYKDLYLLGRLAEYKHIDMDEAVLCAMQLFDKLSEGEI